MGTLVALRLFFGAVMNIANTTVSVAIVRVHFVALRLRSGALVCFFSS
ncbi:MAG: hypothetical protein IPK82_20475 [Polyangiaceae bacterium]|nr:hypothetical protein [Polyangiaceae bacterium]